MTVHCTMTRRIDVSDCRTAARVYSRVLGLPTSGYPAVRLERFLLARAAAGTLGPVILVGIKEGTDAVRAVHTLSGMGVEVTVIPAPTPRSRPHVADVAILEVLADGEAVPVGEIARRVWVSPSALRRRVARLARQGLVVRAVRQGGSHGTQSTVRIAGS